ncbi:hypothetical protein [Rhizobium sp. Leaf386]|uniref:hypothetical protein n=1 Tax=Rhizobium sp. Leaf386 TaxID=1736359 RepID=UPI00071494A4|nr:hypothetical protein [Rhizobium sp. Leaf386]KQT01799.1 hypothetical protein ASG50_19110 [Rhizobium sp. Leaf386]
MTATTDFIAELVRAANSLGQISLFERRRLLGRAIHTIRDMRDIIGIPSSGTDADALLDLAEICSSIHRRTDAEAQKALLEAAGMIRDLRVIVDSKVSIMIGEIRGPEERTP